MKLPSELTSLIANKASYKVAAIYAVVAGLWILFSDRILLWYFEDPTQLTRVQTVKGWSFVFCTAVMLAWLVRRYTRQMKREKDLLENIISNIPFYVFWKDRECRYLGCNHRFASVAGVGARENIVGKTDHDLLWRKDEDELIRQSDRDVMKKREPLLDLEEIQRQADGKEAVFLTSKVPLEDESGNVVGILGICADITVRKHGEEALRASEELFRSVFEAAATGMSTFSPDGRFLQVNPALCRFFGRTEAELLKLGIEEVTHPEDLKRTRRLYEEVMAGKRQAFDYEKRYIRKDGSMVWGHATVAGVLNAAGKPVFYIGLVQDITDRKKAEEAERESERKLVTLTSNLPGMVYRCRNDRDWTMEFISEGCRTLTGYAPEDLLGNRSLSFNDLIHPDDRERLWQHIQAAVKDEQPFELEYRLRTAGGEERWVWERGRGVFGADGELLALEGFIADNTERKEAERGLAFREAFEGLIAGISSRFVALPAAETDSGINTALRDLGDFAGVDRSYVFLFADDLAEMSNSHEWCSPGIEPQIENLQGLPVDETPWFFDKISRQEVVYVPRVTDLPAEASAEKVHWEEQDIRSMVSVPIIASGRLTGFLGFDTVASEKVWNEQDLTLLKTVGEILGSALVRQKAEKEREQLLHDMGERIKELRGLYGMTQLLRQDDPLETLFRKGVILIPPSWHYPEITRAKLRFDDREYVSAPFEETSWKQSADIVVAGQCRGVLEVYYLEPRPTLDEGPFLQEERQLLDSLARALGESIERRQAEDALRESEERFHSIFNATTATMGVLSPTGDIQQVNPAACRFFGYTKEEISKLNVLDLTHPEDRPTTSVLYDEFLVGQRTDADYEKRYLRKDGSAIWGHTTLAPVRDPEGNLLYFVALTQDITEGKRAEETTRTALIEAEEAREKIEAILKSVADGLIFSDMDNRLVLMSASAEALLGKELPDLFLQPLESVIGDKRFLEHFSAIQAGDENEAVMEFELSGEHRRQRREIQAKSTLVRGKRGVKAGVITLLRNVSRERELDRMKSEFISTAAHELRTPLTSVIGFSELLLEQKGFDEEQQAELLSIIYEKSNVLEKIIDDMLNLSRVESGRIIHVEKKWHELGPALDELVSQYRIEFKTHSFEEVLPECPVEIMMDKGKVVQVMENLLSNAVKFSPKGSLIQVICEMSEREVQVSVKDEGIGMTPEQVERVFEKFYRVDSSNTAKEGLGLGMSIAKNIVETHCGRIWVESEQGKGTTVSFTLPLGQENGNND